MRFDMKRQIEMLETLKKTLVRGFANENDNS